jgi:hypothetical protein
MKPQTSDLVVGKLKRKVLREPVGIALHRKIQRFGGNAVEFGQVAIEHDFLAANEEDEPRDVFRFQDDCHAPRGRIYQTFFQRVAGKSKNIQRSEDRGQIPG